MVFLGLLGGFLFLLSGLGLLALALQHAFLRAHLRHPLPSPPPPSQAPPISILKPLCGLDDELEENLASFARLDYPSYEVLLGVPSVGDKAFAVASRAVRRFPGRMRLVVQRYHAGHNPKVNQLVGLARAARHGLWVISDSNVRASPDYLSGIAAELCDRSVGLVTHPVVGAGEQRLGSVLENLHLAGSVGPGMVAAPRLLRQPVVVGKSLALWKRDLLRLGGFEAVQNVLAEDHLLGLLIREKLGKRIVVARRPVVNVNRGRRVGEFWGRYARWSVLQKKLLGGPTYAAQFLLNPVLLSLLGLLLRPDGGALAAFLVVCLLKTLVDEKSARALRQDGFALRHLLLVPAKDLIFGAALLQGLLLDEVDWRGTRLRVLRGTRLAPARARDEGPLAARV